MSEHTFNNFNEFADFLETNKDYISSTALKSFLDVLRTGRKTSCGACKRKNFQAAEDTYRNLFTIITQEDKQQIKTLLNVESVKFFNNNAPMFTF